MKKQPFPPIGPAILALFCLVAGIVHGQSSEIQIRVNHPSGKNIVFTEPVNGTFFWANRKTKQLEDSSGSVSKTTLRIPLQKSGPVTLFVEGINLFLFVRPGDKISVEINPADTAKSFLLSGDNAEGQMAMNIKKAYYAMEANDYLKKDTLIGSALEKVHTDLEQEIRSFKSLYEHHQIDQSFLEYSILNSQYHYAAVMGYMMMSRYYRTTYQKTDPAYLSSFNQADAAAWQKIYDEFPVDNPKAMSTFTYSNYLADYVQNYVNRYEAEKKGTYKPLGQHYLLPVYDFFRTAPVRPAIREYGAAGFIQLESIQESYDSDLVTVYNRFSGQFPKNAYSAHLKQMIDPILAFRAKGKAAFAADQRILPRYEQINSLEELFKPFKGKTVFVDIWATWCGPCKAEFQYGDGLKRFLHDNGAEMLYISMDNNMADAHWQTMVKYYHLSGAHVRTNETLQNELIKLLWGSGYSIPRYLIIDKSGNIAEKEALRPSDKEKLYAQIRKYL